MQLLPVVIRQPYPTMDFGPVVKPLGITVKKEARKVVETSGSRNKTPYPEGSVGKGGEEP